MKIIEDNVLPIIAIVAILIAFAIIATGHAVDGAQFLSVLYTVIGGLTGAHFMGKPQS